MVNDIEYCVKVAIPMYQNKVDTKLLEVETNLMIDQSIFIVSKYIN